MSKSRPIVQIRDKLEQIVGMKPEHPEREEWGDYAVFMKPGKEADEIVNKLGKVEFVESVTRVGSFINVRLKNAYLVSQLDRVLSTQNAVLRGRKIVVEYSSPNIAKHFGIGHLRSTIIGQALYNIYKFLGYEVVGDNHLGDWGTQFGKLLYMMDKEGISATAEINLAKLEESYIIYHKLSEEDRGLDEEARRWFKRLEDGDKTARQLWQKCVDVSMVEFERIYNLLEVKMDNAYGESYYEKIMPEVIAEAKKKGIAKESQGAWIIDIPGQKTPLVLVKSDGATLYATRDLATLKFRRQKWDADIIIYEVGAEQTLHFEQVFAAAKMLGYIRSGCSLIHTKHGLYLGADGKKFATRQGKTIKLEEVLKEAIDRARKLGNSDEETACAVGIGAIKYFDLSHNVQSDIVFDWEKVMALEGNSGPYLQYTFARTQSVLRKAGTTPELRSSPPKLGGERGVVNEEELRVLRWIYRWPEVVEEAAQRFAPNLVCNFIYELAQRFNSFYNKHRILTPSESPPNLGGDAEGEGVRHFRLALTDAVGRVLKAGLEMLGIKALERM